MSRGRGAQGSSMRVFLVQFSLLALAARRASAGLESLKVHLVADDLDVQTYDRTWVDRVADLAFTAPAAAAPPRLVDGAMNGHKALRFGLSSTGVPTATYLEKPDPFNTFASGQGQAGVTVIVVFRPFLGYDETHPGYPIDSYGGVLFDWGEFPWFGFGLRVTLGSVKLNTPTNGGGVEYTNVSMAGRDGAYVAAVRVKFGASSTGYQWVTTSEGDLVPKESISLMEMTTMTIKTDPFCIGVQAKAHDRENRYFTGDVAEFRWYADLLSDVDVEAVQRSLESKYRLFRSADLKTAADNCISATVNPDLVQFPTCTESDVPRGSGRFCCSRCGADCLNGGTLDMPDWDVSQVTSFHGLFQGKSSFAENISAWNTSSVSDFSSAFEGAEAFTSDISSWDMSSATTTARMFFGASSFEADVTGWSYPTATAENARDMFSGATAFTARFANCGTSTIDATPCFGRTYPTSFAANDGPAASWEGRWCDFSGLNIDHGVLGGCSSQVEKGTTCAPTCDDPNGALSEGVCGELGETTAPSCLPCECKAKFTRFGFNFA